MLGKQIYFLIPLFMEMWVNFERMQECTTLRERVRVLAVLSISSHATLTATKNLQILDFIPSQHVCERFFLQKCPLACHFLKIHNDTVIILGRHYS